MLASALPVGTVLQIGPRLRYTKTDLGWCSNTRDHDGSWRRDERQVQWWLTHRPNKVRVS